MSISKAAEAIRTFRSIPVPAPDNAVAPTEPPAVAVRNVLELAADYGIRFS
jgi:hypothetical protein